MQKIVFIALSGALSFSCHAQATQTTLSKQTVTADFRHTDVQQLAEATTVVSSEQIEARSAEHLEQILSFAPNVNFASGSSRARFFQIRGIGEESQFIDPVNPSIGLIIDGIDMTGLGGAAALFDVEQVEILRGPQGTRFGANALGGLINIQSASSSSETQGYVSGKLGNYHSYGLGGAVTGALADNLQGRFAVQQYQSRGFMSNDYLGRDDTQNNDELLLRTKLHWQVNATNSLQLTYFHANLRNGYDAFTVDNSRHSLADEPGQDTLKTHALALKLDSTLSSAVSLQSTITASTSTSLYSYDEDWVNPGYGELWGKGFDAYERDYRRFSGELRLLSGATGRIWADSTDWVIGMYINQRQEKLARDYSWNEGQIYHNQLDTNAASLYTELTSHLSSRTRLITGVRLEHWRNQISDNAHQLDAQDTNLSASTSEWLYGGKLGLEYDVGFNHLSYLTLARGYKAGGINTAPSISADKRKFDTEYNHSLELGLKSDWLESRWQTRLAAFYIDRQDQQAKSSYPIPNTPNFQDYFANAAKGESLGFELESQWQLSSAWYWELSYGYLRARFKEYQYQTDDGLVNKSGRDQLHAPRHSAATALTYAFSEYLSLRFEAEGKSRFYFEDSQDEQAHGYVLYHARLGYQQPRYELALSSRNLTNKTYETRGYGGFNNDIHNPDSHRYVQLGEPRLVMFEGKVRF